MRISQNPILMNQEFKMKMQQKNMKKNGVFDILNPKKEKEKNYVNGESAMMDMYAETMQIKSKTEEIASKIAKGESLSKEEMDYIEEKNPELLRKAKTVSKQRQEIEQAVKKAKSKDEAMKIVQGAKMAIMNGIDFKNEANVEMVKLQFDAIQKVEENVTNGKRSGESQNKIDILV